MRLNYIFRQKPAQMKVPKSEQNSKNAALSGIHKEENHPTPGSLPPSNPPNTPGGDAGGAIKTEIKQEAGGGGGSGGGGSGGNTTEMVGEIKKELNGLDTTLGKHKGECEGAS